MREAEVRARITAKDETKAGFDSAKNTLQGFGNAIKAVIGAAIFREIAQAVGACITAFGEAEQATLRLNIAARNNPYLDSKSVASLQAYADAMRDITGVDDDIITQQAAVLAGFQLTEDQIRGVISAALDWAATGQVTFEQAAQQLARTYSGQLGMLGRMLPALQGLTDEQLRNGAAVEQVSKSYAGMAESMANTVLGTRQKLATAFEGLQESVGKVLSPIEVALNNAGTMIMKGLSDAIEQGLTGPDTNKSLRDFWINIVKVVADVRHFFDQAWLDIGYAFAMVWYGIKKMAADTLSNWADALAKLTNTASMRSQIENALGVQNEPVRQLSNARTGADIQTAYNMWLDAMKRGEKSADAIARVMAIYQVTGKDPNDPIMQLIGALMVLPPAVETATENGLTKALEKNAANPPEPVTAEGRLVENNPIDTPSDPNAVSNDIGMRIAALFGPVVEALSKGDFVGAIFAVIGSLQSLAPLFNIVADALAVVDGLLSPITSALAPLLDFIMILADTVGRILNPILQLLAPIIQIVMVALILFYNLAIMPIGNAIIFVAKLLQEIIAFVYNGIATAINFLLGWLGVHMDYMAQPDWTTGWLEPISGTGGAETGAEGGSGGAGAQYTQGRTINIYVTVNTDVLVGEGGLRDFALIIKRELIEAEALGA